VYPRDESRRSSRQVFTCGPDDDVETALATMKQHHVRRLPVDGFGGTVAGIVSMNDILLAAGKKGSGTPRSWIRSRPSAPIGIRSPT
jgi:CBS domain-containing protein